jgi:hypothetical protein
LELSGLDQSHVQEASTSVNIVAGFSAYLHSIGYSVEQFRRELEESVAYIKRQQGAAQPT